MVVDERGGSGSGAGALQFAARTVYTGMAKWIAATCSVCAIGLMVMSRHDVLVVRATSFCGGVCSHFADGGTNTLFRGARGCIEKRLMAYTRRCSWSAADWALIAGGVAKRIGTPDTLLLFGTLSWRGVSFYFPSGYEGGPGEG